jgi:hypothetical protein
LYIAIVGGGGESAGVVGLEERDEDPGAAAPPKPHHPEPLALVIPDDEVTQSLPVTTGELPPPS